MCETMCNKRRRGRAEYFLGGHHQNMWRSCKLHTGGPGSESPARPPDINYSRMVTVRSLGGTGVP